ncbi:MAG: hypothetical protein IT532_11070 [Burkholderiales bacterium]|nr:hypothetical protein [Burkholderiales bacterium]
MPERNSSAAAALARVVLINEDIKQVVRSAFAINLMALNAILVARRAGTAAAGFGVVAGEMRELSTSLEGCMAGLRRLSDDLLASVTRAMRHGRVERILIRSAGLGEAARIHLDPVLQRSGGRARAIAREIDGQCAHLLEDVESAVRISRMADSLAHMAKIEASWSSDRAGLATVSDELAQSLRGILPPLQALSAKLREIRQ